MSYDGEPGFASEADLVKSFFPNGDDSTAADVDGFSFGDDDLLVEGVGQRDEHALAAEYAARSDDQRAVDRAENLLDRENEQLEDAVFDAQLNNGYDVDDEYGDDYAEPEPGETDEEMAYRVAGEILQSHLAGEALQQSQPMTRQAAETQLSDMLTASTAQALHQLAEVEQSKAERAAHNDALAEQQQMTRQVEAANRAVEMLQPLLDKHNARNADLGSVVNDANNILLEAGYTPDVIAGMDEWSAAGLAQQALASAAERAGHQAITNNVLRRFGGR